MNPFREKKKGNKIPKTEELPNREERLLAWVCAARIFYFEVFRPP